MRIVLLIWCLCVSTVWSSDFRFQPVESGNIVLEVADKDILSYYGHGIEQWRQGWNQGKFTWYTDEFKKEIPRDIDWEAKKDFVVEEIHRNYEKRDLTYFGYWNSYYTGEYPYTDRCHIFRMHRIVLDKIECYEVTSRGYDLLLLCKNILRFMVAAQHISPKLALEILERSKTIKYMSERDLKKKKIQKELERLTEELEGMDE